MDGDHDVIIVGGRPAGASLAARLGKLGRRVLVVDRADLASRPHVPSCPTLHMGTIAMLDELGIPESAYAADAVRFDLFVIEFSKHFTARIPIPPVHGRGYGYSIDRAPFDRVLWESLGQYPTVTARTEFTVDEVLRDDAGRVCGVRGHGRGGEPEVHRAPWVIGADGRFSFVARQVGSDVVEESAEKVSTVYFADWSGLAPLVPGRDLVQVHTTGRGLNVLFFPLAAGRTTICIHERADRVDVGGDAEAWYEARVRSQAPVAARLASARRETPVIGLKRVGNGYRTPAGPGWALVGDAVHFKDPVDGQGIYDALVETKILAEELGRWKPGDDRALVDSYGRRVHEATHGMFLATCKRLADELYSEPPTIVIRTMIRWMLNDEEYQHRFLRFLGREIPPENWLGGVMPRAILRGIAGDLMSPFRRALPGA
jgi:2-polyprenyl-6-methoxyphenol hydroxylase-like FAD-dependent oxidoreductase